MTIQGIHHVQITIPVGQENTARAFYCNLLGLTEIPKPETLRGRGGLWLQVGAQEVHVGTEDGVNRRATKAHIAYEVDALTPWRTRLNNAGIEVIDSIPIAGYDRIECRDPFGNRVEINQRLKQ